MFKNKILSLVALLLISGCITKNISQKGYIFDDSDLSNINVGLTNRENALQYLGCPLNKSNFDKNIWIYYSYKTKEVLFFKPKLMEQKVLVLEFDNETDILKNMSLYKINSSGYELIKGTGEVGEEKENVIKDIFKNIGQVGMQ